MPLSKFRELASVIADCKEPEIQIRPETLDLLREVISLRHAASLFFRNNSSINELFEQSNEDIELGSSKEELFFTLFCFFKDLHDIQTYLGELWQGSKNGDVPLTSAAVTTDLAFDVIKSKEDYMLMCKARTSSAVPLYWRFEKEGSLLNPGYLGELLYSHMSGLNVIHGADGSATKEASEDSMYQIGDWLYTPAYILLDTAESAAGGGEGPRGRPQHKSSGFNVKEFERRFEYLMNLVTELIQIRAAGIDTALSSDIWTKAMCELVDPKKLETRKRMGGRNHRQARHSIPVWMAFATTIYLDIRTLLGSEAERAFRE
ncbi:hypothetical protein BST61_g604 [Cercospora zeina]